MTGLSCVIRSFQGLFPPPSFPAGTAHYDSDWPHLITVMTQPICIWHSVDAFEPLTLVDYAIFVLRPEHAGHSCLDLIISRANIRGPYALTCRSTKIDSLYRMYSLSSGALPLQRSDRAGTSFSTGVERWAFNASARTLGWECIPNGNADSTCPFNLGTLAANSETATVSSGVSINENVPAGVSHVSSTVTICREGANGPDPTPANDRSSGPTPFVPTATTLLNFPATHVDKGAEIRWTPGEEIVTDGSQIYRSTDRNRTNAEHITTNLIPAEGRLNGYTYVFMDATDKPDQIDSYWLQESNGAATDLSLAKPESVSPDDSR